MKLAEALNQRADVQKRLQQLQERLGRNALVQEGDTPSEDPAALLAEVDALLAELRRLITRINRTNTLTPFDAAQSLSDALAARDVMAQERNILVSLIQTASATSFRMGRNEIRYVRTVDVAALQKRADSLAQAYRQLDSQIQALNWTVELLES